MKTKKFDKKLSLNKETISHLNGGQMKYVHAGIKDKIDDAREETYSCYSCFCVSFDTQCNSACSNACC